MIFLMPLVEDTDLFDLPAHPSAATTISDALIGDNLVHLHLSPWSTTADRQLCRREWIRRMSAFHPAACRTVSTAATARSYIDPRQRRQARWRSSRRNGETRTDRVAGGGTRTPATDPSPTAAKLAEGFCWCGGTIDVGDGCAGAGLITTVDGSPEPWPSVSSRIQSGRQTRTASGCSAAKAQPPSRRHEPHHGRPGSASLALESPRPLSPRRSGSIWMPMRCRHDHPVRTTENSTSSTNSAGAGNPCSFQLAFPTTCKASMSVTRRPQLADISRDRTAGFVDQGESRPPSSPTSRTIGTAASAFPATCPITIRLAFCCSHEGYVRSCAYRVPCTIPQKHAASARRCRTLRQRVLLRQRR